MTGPKDNHRKPLEELLRMAGERRFDHAKLRKDEAITGVIERIDKEIARLKTKLERTSRKQVRIFAKAEIVHLEAIRDRLRSRKGPRRWPPEAGIAIPAVPPKGPLPKQGGAEAPLDFDTRA